MQANKGKKYRLVVIGMLIMAVLCFCNSLRAEDSVLKHKVCIPKKGKSHKVCKAYMMPYHGHTAREYWRTLKKVFPKKKWALLTV